MADLLKLSKGLLGEDTLSDILGSIVFSQRIKQGLKQEELAIKSSVEPRIIHRIEGGSSVEIKEFEKVMNGLNLSFKDIGEAIIILSTEKS